MFTSLVIIFLSTLKEVKYLFNNMESTAPVEAGETYDVTIEDIAREGDGIARVSGFVIFVPGAKVGDEVSIKITKVMRKFAFGELV
ncbi:Predicted RNA-binding protein, contains TRAM domain [Methanococcoides vulcani]|uniref:Predicted RNA-binding protein, contains TRAM domain n=2 Tax=Methanosarcinaceae TaxID=2206 RepID=A0A1H9ZXN1_9EURY|nr:Predicted RNA-binding protein, contains TRAM domain [Methanococcoides vulcani]